MKRDLFSKLSKCKNVQFKKRGVNLIQETTFSQKRRLCRSVSWPLPFWRIRTPKQRYFRLILSETEQNLISPWDLYPAPDRSSHKIAQAAFSSQVRSLVPTNCHFVGARAVLPACRGRKDTSAGMKAFSAGKSYQIRWGKGVLTSFGKIPDPHPSLMSWRRAFSGFDQAEDI